MTSGALSVIPVYSSEAPNATEYRTLNEAIALGEVVVTEQSQASVGDLRVVNKGALPVLVLDGEEVFLNQAAEARSLPRFTVAS